MSEQDVERQTQYAQYELYVYKDPAFVCVCVRVGEPTNTKAACTKYNAYMIYTHLYS